VNEDPNRTEELVARAQAGDAEAREALFAKVEASVLELVRRRLGRRLRMRVESVDVAQSALGDAARGIDRFEDRGEGAFRRWLGRIVENKLRHAARRMQHGDRDPARVQPIQPAETDSPGFEPPADVSGLVTRLVRDEERRHLRGAIAALPEREARLIRLRLRGLSWEEVVEQADEASVKAAQGCYARAMARLLAVFGRA